jgi:urease accessory protein UreH
LLAVIPDPVTCFSTARYHQKQVFQVSANSNLVVVDWFTSGRYECGEKWDFSFYKSVNHIFLGDHPLFIDSVKTLDLVLLGRAFLVQSISVKSFYNYQHIPFETYFYA